MTRTRIAFVGAGLIGLRHIEEIGKSHAAALATIVDVAPKSGRTVAIG